jgi:hypothetical protein
MLHRVKIQWREYHLKYVYCLDNNIHFKPLHVLCLELAEAFISKEMIDLRESISYPFWQ